jgi:hypothetical protein
MGLEACERISKQPRPKDMQAVIVKLLDFMGQFERSSERNHLIIVAGTSSEQGPCAKRLLLALRHQNPLQLGNKHVPLRRYFGARGIGSLIDPPATEHCNGIEKAAVIGLATPMFFKQPVDCDGIEKSGVGSTR